MNNKNNKINYVEFRSTDLKSTKEFYQKCFDWQFTDYGPTYTSFSESGLDGGFEKTEEPIVNGALIVLYHENLKKIRGTITATGGSIPIDIFSFPGGKRFHFLDPSGNELAIWSDK